jgi:hypothetical protein
MQASVAVASNPPPPPTLRPSRTYDLVRRPIHLNRHARLEVVGRHLGGAHYQADPPCRHALQRGRAEAGSVKLGTARAAVAASPHGPGQNHGCRARWPNQAHFLAGNTCTGLRHACKLGTKALLFRLLHQREGVQRPWDGYIAHWDGSMQRPPNRRATGELGEPHLAACILLNDRRHLTGVEQDDLGQFSCMQRRRWPVRWP